MGPKPNRVKNIEPYSFRTIFIDLTLHLADPLGLHSTSEALKGRSYMFEAFLDWNHALVILLLLRSHSSTGHLPNRNFLCSLCIILFIYWWILFVSILLKSFFSIYIHRRYWSVVFFSCNDFVDTDLIECVGKCTLFYSL